MTRPRDNRDRIVSVSVAGRIADARRHPEPVLPGDDGEISFLPGAGGVVLGVHAGDPVDRWVGDHLMPGAGIEDAEAGPADPGSLHLLACIGNPVRDGRAAFLGVVSGKRGGLAPSAFAPNLVSVEASEDRLRELVPGDRVVLEAEGRGLGLVDHPGVALSNSSPRLLDALPLEERDRGLHVSVRTVVPSRFAGPGLGQDAWIGDLEILSDGAADPAPDDLRFGDLVAFEDVDSAHGRFYRPGFVSVGIVSHGPSRSAGHGPGVTIVLSGPAHDVTCEVSPDAATGALLRAWAEDG